MQVVELVTIVVGGAGAIYGAYYAYQHMPALTASGSSQHKGLISGVVKPVSDVVGQTVTNVSNGITKPVVRGGKSPLYYATTPVWQSIPELWGTVKRAITHHR